MKTLDEVIKGFECCENTDCGNCPYKILFNDDSHVPCDQFSKDEDALYYLKEYREKQYELSAIFDQYQAELAEDPNEPLTWEELKQMEGKPVWVSYDCWWGADKIWGAPTRKEPNRWNILENYDPKEKIIRMCGCGIYGFLREDYIGRHYNVYRKEQE